MKLNFLGCGASFFPQGGNNAAYFIDHDELFLIDIGEDVFAKLINKGLLENIQAVHLMVTHLHSDHIGSLGSMILYCYYAMHKPLNIIYQEDLKYFNDLKQLIQIFGCSDALVNYRLTSSYVGYDLFDEIQFIETDHCDTLDCYGIKFVKDGITTYYSGDTRELTQIKNVLDNDEFDYVYVDVNTSNDDNRVHLFIDELLTLDHQYFSKIYCMHFNSQACIDQALAYGLQVVKTI